jgi:polynucleotide 5'-hydroxyl-kinase GRC3/NOL9
VNDIIAPESWKELVSHIEAYKGKAKIFVLGAVDTGKSYLCSYLVKQLCKNGKSAALIDTDPGQSLLGPPATVAMALFRETRDREHYRGIFQRPDSITTAQVLSMGFVGSISPAGNFLQVLVGLKKLIDKAVSYSVPSIIINTSGLISQPGGREFKFQKIDMVAPSHLIAVQRTRELEPIVKNFAKRPSISLTRLKISPAVRRKTPAERISYRKRLFDQYFQDATPLCLSLFSFGLHGRVPDLRFFTQWEDMVIALCDEKNFALALARIENFSEGIIQCITPLKDKKKIKSIQFGTFYLNS